jgi:hypothetical protein
VTVAGWLFMGAAWAGATVLLVWCYARILRHDRQRR